jgi:type II secretory pathway component GspD/PulD (secretin)
MRPTRFKRVRMATTALLCLFVAGTSAFKAQAQSAADEETLVQVDFASVRLFDLAEFFARVSGQNLIFVPDTLGDRTVTVVSPRPIPIDEFQDLLEAVLSLHGLVVERRAHYWLIREP